MTRRALIYEMASNLFVRKQLNFAPIARSNSSDSYLLERALLPNESGMLDPGNIITFKREDRNAVTVGGPLHRVPPV